ncbi:hypothetical protein D770_14745 [Flammeovirgaceae bacterium 311]|nr:hypothetical protein D770_14745 [Flammeovirgaceae bacterium 311]
MLVLLLCCITAYAQVPADQLPPRPNPPMAVNDLANTMSSSQRQQLERKLRNYNDTASTAIVVATIQSTGAYEIADYATSLGHAWGVGRSDVDNGLLILVALKDRQVWIATGYGVEGAIPDAIAKRVVEQIIKPRFRQNDYYGGLDEATSALMSYAAGEYSDLATGPQRERRTRTQEEGSPIGLFMALFFLIFFIILPMRAARRAQRRHLTGKRSGGGCMGPLGMAILMGSMGRRGGGGFGGGGFGGGGGGGFGGFGGGGFGGGGAGGSW